MSACLNSMSGVLFEDFIRPRLSKPVPESKASLIMKISVAVIGITTVLLASVVEKLGGIIQVRSEKCFLVTNFKIFYRLRTV